MTGAGSKPVDIGKADKGPGSLSINVQPSGLVEVSGLQMELVGDAAAAQRLMEAGIKNRSVGSTAMNSESSRSHLIVSIRVDAHNLATGLTAVSKLHLVDLAGSERLSR